MRARVLLSLAALVVAIPIAVGLFLILVWLVVGTLVLLVSLASSDSAEAAERRWRAPVSGAPTRLFHLGPNPFLRGQHRGVDLAAAPGEAVRAACAGRVVFAGRVAGRRTVSVRCGRWRVSYAPLTRLTVRAGERVGSGARLGRAAQGIHVGVRREGRRFGYVDPLPFLTGSASPPPAVPVRVRPPPPRATPPAIRAAHLRPALAPWPVWLGLTLLLAGLVGGTRARLPRRRREGAPSRASSSSTAA